MLSKELHITILLSGFDSHKKRQKKKTRPWTCLLNSCTRQLIKATVFLNKKNLRPVRVRDIGQPEQLSTT